MKTSLSGRAALIGAVTAAFVLALAAPASAHITVEPGTAEKGDYTKVSFRVPNESDTASTTKVEINFPADTPIASVSLKPVQGWTAEAVRAKLPAPVKTIDGEVTEAVTKVTWTAAGGGGVKPGEFQEFDVSLGPLPDADRVIFKALQTYSDGSISRWIDEPASDGAEPESPAPVLALTAAGAAPAGGTAPAADAAAEAPAEEDGGVNALGLAAVLVSLAALVLGLLAYRRAAQSTS